MFRIRETYLKKITLLLIIAYKHLQFNKKKIRFNKLKFHLKTEYIQHIKLAITIKSLISAIESTYNT